MSLLPRPSLSLQLPIPIFYVPLPNCHRYRYCHSHYRRHRCEPPAHRRGYVREPEGVERCSAAAFREPSTSPPSCYTPKWTRRPGGRRPPLSVRHPVKTTKYIPAPRGATVYQSRIKMARPPLGGCGGGGDGSGGVQPVGCARAGGRHASFIPPASPAGGDHRQQGQEETAAPWRRL